MEETTLQKEKQSPAQKNMRAYLESHDVKYVAEDAVFRNLTTGATHRGKAEIGAMLHYMYHVAFDARAEVTNFIITEDKAMFEGFFKGRHIGEFEGIKPTNKEVDVPLCVTYDLKDGLITQARIYFLADVLVQQLGLTAPGLPLKTAFVVRDIFHLKYGQYRQVKTLLDEAYEKGLFPEGKQQRILTDFTGDSYRLIMEEGYDSLSAYEGSLSAGLATEDFHQWYEKFKPHIEKGSREILRQVI
jgi:predicted ester cyclase